MEIRNRIIKTELVNWKSIKWFQNDGLKKLDAENMLKLKRSLVNNNFVMPFHVWESEGELYFLDGHHREKAMRELEQFGFDNQPIKIPDLLPANFIDATDREEAAKLVLIYSSLYARITEDGLTEFFKENKLDLNVISTEISLPEIKLDRIILNDIPEEKLDDVPAPAKKPLSKLADVFVLDGKHRVMCGDSTKKEDVAKLMDGKKADMVFTDPPYGMMLNADFSDMVGIGRGKKYKNVQGDGEDFKPELITTVFENFSYCKEVFLWGGDYYAELIPNRNVGCFMVWDKMQGGEGVNDKYDKMFGSNFELVWSKSRHKRAIVRILWKGIFGLGQEDTKKRVHPTQKPTKLVIWFFEKFSFQQNEKIIDLFLGSGSTLIACEQTNRICYGMEIDPIYIDVILRRYHSLYPDKKIECLNRSFNFEKLWAVE